MRLAFTKMQGLGNDFMVLDLVNQSAQLQPDQIRRLADRHFGVGFDQLLLVEPPSEAGIDFNYRIFNADGSEVEHCGNGARCFAVFVTEKGLTGNNPVRVKTANRVLSLKLDENGEVTVDMGTPVFDPAAIPFRSDHPAHDYSRTLQTGEESREIRFSAVSMGNPHAVIIVEDLDNTAVKDIGEALGRHPDFPEGANVGFMQILARDEIRLRVYERGCGETLACGTGACAAVVCGCLLGHLGDAVKVNLNGGQLSVTWQGGSNPVLMTGPATTVYEGSVDL